MTGSDSDMPGIRELQSPESALVYRQNFSLGLLVFRLRCIIYWYVERATRSTLSVLNTGCSLHPINFQQMFETYQ